MILELVEWAYCYMTTQVHILREVRMMFPKELENPSSSMTLGNQLFITTARHTICNILKCLFVCCYSVRLLLRQLVAKKTCLKTCKLELPRIQEQSQFTAMDCCFCYKLTCNALTNAVGLQHKNVSIWFLNKKRFLPFQWYFPTGIASLGLRFFNFFKPFKYHIIYLQS